MAGANNSHVLPIGQPFAVNVKTDCPHLQNAFNDNLMVDTKAPCKVCAHIGENWLCLACSEIHCSRYVNEHMVLHNNKTRHPIAMSFLDASVWCYSCDSYIDSPVLQQICRSVALSKS